jgi:hypothetical protein
MDRKSRSTRERFERAADGLDGMAERGRVGGVPGEDADSDRAPLGVGEQPVLDLRPALLAVPSRE